MKNDIRTAANWSGTLLLGWASMVSAQTVHEVQVLDNAFSPSTVNIEVGDTVRWVNPANNGNPHNVVSDDGLWTPPAIAESWTFEFLFENEGSFGFFCTPHQNQGMRGTVNVTDPNAGSGVDINVGHNGNWWSGTSRDGEGAQVEISDGGGGTLVFVATIYSYGPPPDGGQIFLIGVGTPDGESVTIDLFITDGGAWGADFDPSNVAQIPFGSGVVTSGGCDSLTMTLSPNQTYLGLGYSEFTLDLIRVKTSLIECPFEVVKLSRVFIIRSSAALSSFQFLRKPQCPPCRAMFRSIFSSPRTCLKSQTGITGSSAEVSKVALTRHAGQAPVANRVTIVIMCGIPVTVVFARHVLRARIETLDRVHVIITVEILGTVPSFS